MTQASERIEDEILTRIRLYDYSTGKQTFFQWLAGLLPACSGKDVLELGAGDGAIWRDLLPRWPECHLTLTDIAEDVLDAARVQLEPLSAMTRGLEFKAVDFNHLPYANDSFDVVLANHNLYYAQDVPAVLDSIHQVLRPGGMLICSTIGQDHLHELATILRQEDAELPWGAERWADDFGLENGARLLSNSFAHIDQYEYDNNLHVNSIEPVIAYLLKTMKGLLAPWVSENMDTIRAALEARMAQKGYIRLTPHSGFFIAYKAAD